MLCLLNKLNSSLKNRIKTPGQNDLLGEFYQNFKEELIPIICKISQKLEKYVRGSISFYESSITLI